MANFSSLAPRYFHLNANAPVLGQIGGLQTRLARSNAEIKAAQALRYAVFCNELQARPRLSNRLLRRDTDPFDAYCDHLLVLDHSKTANPVVGTYRMLLPEQAARVGGYYSQGEFDLSPLFAGNRDSRVMELGRSCILSPYRNKRTMELLWHGTWAHALENKVDLMFGCASFIGTDPKQHRQALAWLVENAGLDKAEDCGSTNELAFELGSLGKSRCNTREALAQLPPLLKGYLRLGAKVGSHAVIDRQFGTIDVLVVLKVSQVNPRYLSYFGADASRFAA